MTSQHRWKMGAVITKGSKVMSYAVNVHRNDSNLSLDGSSWHAEENALRSLAWSSGLPYTAISTGVMKGYTLWVARVNRLGCTRLARPCKACWKVIKDAGITEVFYTNESGSYSKETIHPNCSMASSN